MGTIGFVLKRVQDLKKLRLNSVTYRKRTWARGFTSFVRSTRQTSASSIQKGANIIVSCFDIWDFVSCVHYFWSVQLKWWSRKAKNDCTKQKKKLDFYGLNSGWMCSLEGRKLLLILNGHGNEADFLGFLQILGPHRSLTLPFEPFRFWLRICGDIPNRKTTPRLSESGSRRLSDSASRGVADSPTWRVGESTTHRLVESGSRLLNV